MMMTSGVIYVGMPVTKRDVGGAVAEAPSSSASANDTTTITFEPTQQNNNSNVTTSSSSLGCGFGLLAFFVGVLLASFAWVANQGWLIASLLMFGNFTWTLESAWKHVLVGVGGSICTSIAFWAVFQMIFPSFAGCDDQDEDRDERTSNKRDVSNALQDLGELGFLVGYLCSQNFLLSVVYNPLVGLGIECDKKSNAVFDGATLVLVLMWMLCTKVRDYKRAVERVNNNSNYHHINGEVKLPVAQMV